MTELYNFICQHCGAERQAPQPNRKYCNKKCHGQAAKADKNGFRVCACCGEKKTLENYSRKQKNRYYSYCKTCNAQKLLLLSHTANGRWRISKAKAKKRGLAWELDKTEYTALISQSCHYCKGKLGIAGVGLDRKDNSIGYSAGNVVPCCKRCNVVKNDYFTYGEMMLLSPVLCLIESNRRIIA